MCRDANRLPLMPDLASADKQGLIDFDVSSRNAFFLPKSTPASRHSLSRRHPPIGGIFASVMTFLHFATSAFT
jgi:hypothetical protein